MPRNSQIVPQYKFPYTETYYNDNTTYQDVNATEVVNGFRSLCVFASPRGRDNVIITKTTSNAFIEEYGNVDFKTYGQAALNAYNILRSGQSIVHCMRVMPTDANLANAVLVAKVKVTTKDGTPDYVAVPTTFKAVSTLDSTENTLSWTAVEGASKYEILINGDVNATVETSGTTYAHSGLIKGNAVTYKVRAIVSGKTSAWSNAVTVTTGTAEEVTAEDTEAPTKVNDSLLIKYEMVSVDGMKTDKSVSTYLEELVNTEVDAEGFKTVPLFAVYSLGRGTYGNFYRIRLVSDRIRSEELEVMTYRLEVYDTTSGMTLKKRHTVTLNPDDIFGNKSYFLPDIVSDESEIIGAEAYDDGLKTIYDIYKEAFPANEVDIADFDIVEGLTVAGKTIPNLTIYTPNEDDVNETAISLSRSDGCALAYGSDGSLAPTNPNFEDALNKCYVEAFNCETNPSIKSKRKYPTEVMFDANYSVEAKLALVDLVTKRGDCQVILDAGIIDTVYEAIEWGKSDEMLAIDDWRVSKTFQNGVIKDPFTNRNIRVTAPYFYTSIMPNHYFTVGRQNPMTGSTYGRVTGIVRNKLEPMVEYDDVETKAPLYDARLNYIETIAEGVFVIGTQSTSQVKLSDMIEMHNAAILLHLKRILDEICVDATYRFAEEDDRANYTEIAGMRLNEYRDWYRTAEVSFEMNEFEEERGILHCYLAVVLKAIAKNCIIEIDINPRS